MTELDRGKIFDIFLDNGIIRNTLVQNRQDRSNTFQQVFEQQIRNTGNDNDQVHFISTPLMLIEYAGEVLEPLTQQDADLAEKIKSIFNKRPFDSNEIITEAIEALKTAAETRSITNYEGLKDKLAQHRPYRCEWGKIIVDDIFMSNLAKPETRTRFVTEIALDELQGFDLREVYGSIQVDDRISRISAALASFLFHDSFNVALPRIVNQFYRATTDGPTRSETQQFDYDFSGNHQDRVDTQLIHFACVGHKRDDTTYPVLCFTNENWDRTVKRVEAYLNHAIHLKHKFSEIEFNPKPGKIIQTCQETGVQRDELDLLEAWNELSEKYLSAELN